MQIKILHPIILKLFLLRNELYYLEKLLDSYQNNDTWPVGLYEDVLLTTDKFYRVRDKAIKIIGSEQDVDNCIYILDKNLGKT